MQITPAKELLPYIKHYLFLETAVACTRKLRLFSDGNTGMVLTFAGTLLQDDGALNYPNSFLYGQINEFKDLYLTGKTMIIIVVFQPYGFNRLSGIPANEIRGKIISTGDIFGAGGVVLHDKLSENLKPEALQQQLNSFFIEVEPTKPVAMKPVIQTSLNYLLSAKGVISIQQLVKYTGYTERHIERTFKEYIGINPKKFGTTLKLHQFLRLLKYTSRVNNFTSLCYEAGYADQSHLIKEFRKYTGITPTQYLNNTNRLAVNFLEFNSNNEAMSGLYNLQPSA
jgi:AraC-like DNA-binding protein